MNLVLPATTEGRVYGGLVLVELVALVVFVVLWIRAGRRAGSEARLRRRTELRETTALTRGRKEGYTAGRHAGYQLARSELARAADNVVASAAADDPDNGDVTQQITRPGDPPPVRTADATVEFDRCVDDNERGAT